MERKCTTRFAYGLHSYGLHIYGLYSYGLWSYGLWSYGLYSSGLSSCGLYSYGLWCCRKQVFVYSTDHGWDFGAFYKSPESKVKACVASHEALVYRPRAGLAYEHKAMALELLRRMRPDTLETVEPAAPRSPTAVLGVTADESLQEVGVGWT